MLHLAQLLRSCVADHLINGLQGLAEILLPTQTLRFEHLGFDVVNWAVARSVEGLVVPRLQGL